MLVLAQRQRWTRAPAAREVGELVAPEDLGEGARTPSSRSRSPPVRGPPSASSVADLLEILVDLRVDAADEEARDAGHAADVLAALVAAAEPGDVRARHAL